MGLNEKRAIKSIQDGLFPKMKQETLEILGFEVEFEVKWDTLIIDDISHLYEEGFEVVYFRPMIDAFKSIVSDDLGKEALQAALKKIVIKSENDIGTAPRWAAFENGVLTLDHKINSNFTMVSDRKETLQALLEKTL
ncbi:MAG: hypothetical protein F6K17_37785 [Okeania sp. SIO3C4]|nr:hypothetical protein [Okeania sp. SIO3C4]